MIQPLSHGTMLGNRYKVLELIAQGGMGAVYKCADSRLEGRLCAVKEVWIDSKLSPTYAEQSQEQFRREATTLATLDHPNLPKVSDFFSHRGRYYLVMDYVAGQDLQSLIRAAQRERTRLPLVQVLDWTDQICSALNYLHNQNPPILHRDIKPANIKVTENGLVKLVDFGLVKWMAPDDNSTITVIQGLGTAAYTPLEQYGADVGHTDARTDIYALGATVYHLITSQQPASAKERFLKPDSLPSPEQIAPDLPAYVTLAIVKALAMHPEDRPSTILDFQSILHGKATDLPSQALTKHSLNLWQLLIRKDPALVVVTGVLLLAALLLSLRL